MECSYAGIIVGEYVLCLSRHAAIYTDFYAPVAAGGGILYVGTRSTLPFRRNGEDGGARSLMFGSDERFLGMGLWERE